MFRRFRAPIAATVASVSVITAAACAGGLAVFLSGVLEVKAEPKINVAVHHAKADRLPVLAKGTACSSLGWPHYEQSCQFDMRRQHDDVRTVRIVGLRSSFGR
jgi:hypothetical protein